MFYCTSLTKIFVIWLFSGKIHLYENSSQIKQTRTMFRVDQTSTVYVSQFDPFVVWDFLDKKVENFFRLMW